MKRRADKRAGEACPRSKCKTGTLKSCGHCDACGFHHVGNRARKLTKGEREARRASPVRKSRKVGEHVVEMLRLDVPNMLAVTIDGNVVGEATAFGGACRSLFDGVVVGLRWRS